MVKANESSIKTSERFNKFNNGSELYDKYYQTKEINLKFLLTLHDHLEHKVSPTREGI